MLSGIVALLILQEVVGKAQVGAELTSDEIGKTAATPSACVEMPEPGADARSQSWYIDNEAMDVGGGRFVKYGLPRVLAQWEVEFHAASAGGLFYAEAGAADPEVLYLLVDPAGCEFQPYQREG